MRVRSLRLIHSPTPAWEEVRAFYRDLLGLEETGGWDLPGDRGSFLAAGPGEIEVMEQDAAALGIVPPGAGPWHLALEVENVDAAVETLRARGVPIVSEVQARPWGTRDCVIRDPAGNAVLLFSG